jgi:3-oxoacyl-[acyl-carrier protein] reductase
MDYGLRGRTAVVTGGDSGISFASAAGLLREGARVLLSDRDPDSLEEALQKLRDLGEVHGHAADLTKPAEVAALRDAALSKLGHVDILLNGAGITGAQGDFLEIGDEGWEEAIQTNLFSAVRVTRALLPGMKARGWGRVIFIASEDAVQPYADELPYCASKAALLNLSKGLSKAYARNGILVNTVSPAFIATPMTDAMMEKRAKKTGTSFEEAIQSFLKEERPTLELRRRGEAEEVAAAVLFLCSAGASFVTGATIRVDGGSVAALAT